MSKDETPPATDDLNSLDARLKQARDGLSKSPLHPPAGLHDDKDSDRKAADRSAMGMAFRIGVDIVSALIVGGLIGWFLDQWLDTRPWMMLVFFILGGAAGILNVYRYALRFNYRDGYERDVEPDNDQGK